MKLKKFTAENSGFTYPNFTNQVKWAHKAKLAQGFPALSHEKGGAGEIWPIRITGNKVADFTQEK